MSFKELSPTFSAAPQLSPEDVAQAAREGFKIIVSHRHDGEDSDQPSAAEMATMVARHGMRFVHIPVTPGDVKDADVAAFVKAIGDDDVRVLGYCKTGKRAASFWALSQGGEQDADAIIKTASAAGYDISELRSRIVGRAALGGGGHHHKIYDIVIVGGGSGGIAAAASILKRRRDLSIAVIEPADVHYYQPGFPLIGAGVFTPDICKRTMASVMPDRVTWIQQRVTGFAPDSNEVILEDGVSIKYRGLIASPGIKLNWAGIPGLAETLGENGVTSNYLPDLAPYTHQLATNLKSGRALFTQPPMPIKCAGAPQKAMYLSCDSFLKNGVLKNIEVDFHNAGAVLFGVPQYVPALMSYVEKYGIKLNLESKLVAVDGPNRVAAFERKGADGAMERITREFDMMHAVPPQVAPEFVAKSPLAAETGFIAVDQFTLQHVRYPNVFALGDATTTPNAKTAAAARKQAPVVAVNLLAVLDGKEPMVAYDGYGSCPLTVERGKIVLAEFGYGGKLLPSFPKWLLDGTKPTRAAWYLKDRLLPPIYWHLMLKGREYLCKPHMHNLNEETPAS
jgi:sulfide:quinone oxidoreductase